MLRIDQTLQPLDSRRQTRNSEGMEHRRSGSAIHPAASARVAAVGVCSRLDLPGSIGRFAPFVGTRATRTTPFSTPFTTPFTTSQTS